MAAAAKNLSFEVMGEAEVRQWVEANPGRVNDSDNTVFGLTPLVVAAWKHTHSLVVWLLDEKGAEVNAPTLLGNTALHMSKHRRSSLPCWIVTRFRPG